tara:strand:+ start:644 stop:928 length:285 start_codon:yes stop_codon:yes gene_type:complete
MATNEKQSKFSEEDLGTLRDLQEKYFQIQQKLGNVKITRLNLEKQLEELDGVEKSIENEYISLKDEEVKVVDDFTEKYGHGSLDTKTGLFTKKD